MLNPRLRDFTPVPARATLPGGERRDPAARGALVRRICREFEELPGTSLTLGQASRLFGLPGDVSGRVLGELVSAGVLQLGRDGQYRRRSSAA
jgi:hypothetical protein